MKVHEKAKRFERVAQEREFIIAAMVPLLKVDWTPEVENKGSAYQFWTQYAFITENTMDDTFIAFHVRYATAQPSLGNKRDKYTAHTYEEVVRHPPAYMTPEFLARLRAVQRRTSEIGHCSAPPRETDPSVDTTN